MGGISELAEDVLASEEGLCCMGLVSIDFGRVLLLSFSWYMHYHNYSYWTISVYGVIPQST